MRRSERMAAFNRAARRAGRIDSQAAGRPRNLITGRNSRQKESALMNGFFFSPVRSAAAAESDVNKEEESEG